MSAFDDFFRDSGLSDHVPSIQRSMLHRQHVTQLLRGDARPVADVPIHDPQQVVRALQDYFPSDKAVYPNKAALRRATEQHQASQAEERSREPYNA